jgi:hypothetical protein
MRFYLKQKENWLIKVKIQKEVIKNKNNNQLNFKALMKDH